MRLLFCSLVAIVSLLAIIAPKLALAASTQAAEESSHSSYTVSTVWNIRGLPQPAQTTPTPPPARARVSPGPIIGLACAFVASTLALGLAVGIRRRIDRIAGPPPDEEED